MQPRKRGRRAQTQRTNTAGARAVAAREPGLLLSPTGAALPDYPLTTTPRVRPRLSAPYPSTRVRVSAAQIKNIFITPAQKEWLDIHKKLRGTLKPALVRRTGTGRLGTLRVRVGTCVVWVVRIGGGGGSRDEV